MNYYFSNTVIATCLVLSMCVLSRMALFKYFKPAQGLPSCGLFTMLLVKSHD